MVLVAAVAEWFGPASSLTWLVRLPVVLVLPGWLALGGVLRDRFAARLGAAMTLSVALLALAVDVLAALGWTNDALVPSWILVATLVLLGRGSGPPIAKLTAVDGILLAVAVVAASCGRIGQGIEPMSDVGMQLAILTRVGETGLPLTTSPFLREPTRWQYADAWHRLLATGLADPVPAGADVLDLWFAAAPVVAIIGALGFGLFASQLLSPVGIVVAVAAHCAVQAPLRLSYPSAIAGALMWAGLGLALRTLGDGARVGHGDIDRGSDQGSERSAGRVGTPDARRCGLLAVVIAVGIAAIHPVEVPLLAAALGAYAVALALTRRRLAALVRPMALAVGLVVAAIPVVIFGNRFLLEQVAAGQIIDPGNEFRRLAAGVFVVDPRYWGASLRSWLVWPALVVLPLVWRRAGASLRAFVAGSVGVVGAGLLCPPVAQLAIALGLPSFLLARTGILFPLALILGAAVELALPPAARMRLAPTVARALVGALVTVALLATWSGADHRPGGDHPLLGARGLALLESIPRGSVVLTDFLASDFLPAGGGHYAVAGITWHTASTRDQLAVADFLMNPAAPPEELADLLRRRCVSHVLLVDWPAAADWPGYGSVLQTGVAAARLRVNPATFVEIGSGEPGPARLLRVVRRPAALVPLPDVGSGWSGCTPGPPRSTLGDWEVRRVVATAREVRIELCARVTTREAPAIAAIALPPGFEERSVLDRIRRRLRGPELFYAEGRPAPHLRIDSHFFTGRAVLVGEATEVVLPLQVPAGWVVHVGPADGLPPFPMPLGPPLAATFVATETR